VAREPAEVPFWEIAPENVIGDGGRVASLTRAILARDPVISHGLSLSVGGFDPFDDTYLTDLADFLIASGSPWHSEHLCFTSVDGATTHELLPMPFTRASARHAAAWVLAYAFRVHEATWEAPAPEPGACRLLASRDAQGFIQWRELTEAAACLLARARGASLAATAEELGLADLPGLLSFLAGLREAGAVLGFREA